MPGRKFISKLLVCMSNLSNLSKAEYELKSQKENIIYSVAKCAGSMEAERNVCRIKCSELTRNPFVWICIAKVPRKEITFLLLLFHDFVMTLWLNNKLFDDDKVAICYSTVWKSYITSKPTLGFVSRTQEFNGGTSPGTSGKTEAQRQLRNFWTSIAQHVPYTRQF